MNQIEADRPQGFVRTKQRALASAVPLAVHLELTYRCNWRCVFCYNPRHHDEKALGVDEWIAVLDDLRALGTLVLTLTGGEPLTHPHFFDIAEAARERAFALKIFTNGSRIDAARADRLAALRPLAVEMSLHGASGDTHDRTTATPGSFESMWTAVDRLQKRSVPLVVKVPLTHMNEPELDDMIALAASRDVPLRIDPTLTPRDDGDRSPLQYAASAEAVDRLMLRLRDRGELPPLQERTLGGVNCGLGRLTAAIDPEGNVYPCIQWRATSLGNVRDTPLRELWHASPARKQAADIAVAANDALLAAGGAEASFPFCPALAQQRTGNPLTPDPAFRLSAAAAERARAIGAPA